MALKTFKPYTKSTRGTILVDRSGLWKGKPFKALVSPKNSMKGTPKTFDLSSPIAKEITSKNNIAVTIGPKIVWPKTVKNLRVSLVYKE